MGYFSGKLGAQTAAYEKITIEQGLSQGMIFDIVQTRDGFLWVATKDGLNRYDGYNFKVFANDPFNPFSIAENTVTALFEDSRGWLWAGLESKGVDVYDPKTGYFWHFQVQDDSNKSLWGSSIEALLEVPTDHSICALSKDGVLLHFPMPATWKNGLPDLSEVSLPQSLPMPPRQLKYPGIPHIFTNMGCRPDGTIAVFGHQMFYEADLKTGTVRALEQFFDKKLCIEAIRADVPGEEIIWTIGGLPTALSKSELTRFRNGKPTAFPFPNSLKDEWKRFSPGEAGHIWLAVGKFAFDLAPDETPDFSKPDLTFDVFPCLLKRDRTGNFWAGTIGYGMRKTNPKQAFFHAGAAGTSLEGLWENGGQYYVKTLTHIKKYDPQTRQILPAPAFLDAPIWQINLAFEPSGAAWLLCREESDLSKSLLLRYAPGNHTKADASYPFDARLSFLDPMFRTRDGRIWIAAHNGRLVHFDPRTERFDYFEIGHLFNKKTKSLTAIAIAEDAEGTLWVGTQLGLVKGTPKRPFSSEQSAKSIDFQLVQADPKNPNGLNNNTIACILPTPDGQIWLGTKGGGINILNPKTGNCRHITTDDGLLNNVVYGILPGNQSNEFWCSTNRGLAKIVAPNKPDGKFAITTYTAALGLQDNEFNTQAFFKAESGELLFGGINGLNRFFPEKLRADTTPPPVFIVGIEINHQKIKFAASPGTLEKLELDHDENNISIEFAALDFTDPSKNRYRYRLVGLDPNWVEAGNHRFAHFSHLAPGKYELRVQGSNGESAWREAPPLILVVNPPWYRSNLAYFCYFLLLAWAAWKAQQFQIRRVKEREQLAFEQRETERVKALEQLKTNFFSNVTHEFRTPLTLIIEPLRQLLKNPDDRDRDEKIRLAERNSRQLLSLVNQLLDMAKLESGQMSLDLRRGNFAQTTRDVFEAFLPLAEKRGVKLVFRQEVQDLQDFDFDSSKVELILNNLISNALKFTPEGGLVEITIDDLQMTIGASSPEVVVPKSEIPIPKSNVPKSEIPIPKSDSPRVPNLKSKIENRKSKIAIQVKDTGIGMPSEALGKIFDRFYQVDGSSTRTGEGTGIGLALSKELAELMGGGIAVESELGKGSVFTFWLPLASAASVGVTQSHPDTTLGSQPGETAEKPVVLVIEDNTELRSFIKKSIAPGWQVVEASNGDEGINKALELVPDLVISDLMMPQKDGFAVVDELKNAELTAHIPIVLLTAKSGIESKLKGLQRGADDYLTKPFSTEELLARMENLVETRRKLREYYARSRPHLGTAAEQIPAELLADPDREFLRRFTLLVEQHLGDEDITPEDFAAKMFISRMQLHRKLTALTNQSVTDFVRGYRLDRAYAMLRNREGNVGEVAGRTAFPSTKHFARVFKEKFGVSPSEVQR